MKNWKKAGIGALCVALLLAGCGNRGAGGDTAQPEETGGVKLEELSPDTLRATNDPRAA